MMGRLSRLVVVLAAFAPLLPSVPAGDAEARDFSGDADFCHPLDALELHPGQVCPWVHQSGTVSPGPCEVGTCILLVTLLGEGSGVASLRKTMTVDATLENSTLPGPLCASESSEAAVSCLADDVLLSINLADGDCASLRLGTTMREAADVPPALPIRAENGWTACRAGNVLTLE